VVAHDVEQIRGGHRKQTVVRVLIAKRRLRLRDR
jgi:hypothetical protein